MNSYLQNQVTADKSLMDGSLIVAAQLSSLFTPYQATSIVLPTRQTDAPFPSVSTNAESPAEHAIFSDFFSSSLTGTLVLRLIHGGLILELLSLTYDSPPVRIVFPAAVLPSPSVALWEDRELHVLAFTDRGSLFRIVLPVYDGAAPWKNATLSGDYSFREYLVSRFKSASAKLVQVLSAHSVAIGLDDGSLVRLETREMGEGNENDQWDEAISSHTSLLSSLTSFLHAGTSTGAEIVSVTCLPQPTDVGSLWTLSRDRTLRMWTVSGCVSAKVLSILPSGRNVSPAPGVSPIVAGALLQKHPQRLLRAFLPSWSSSAHVLVFIPTETSSANPGYFQLFDTVGDHLQVSEVIECSASNVQAHIQDFMVAGNTLYSLWDRGGQSVVEACVLHAARDSKHTWQTATYPQEAELTPAYLDELLLSPGSLTDRYFEAVMRPGMFSPLTLQTALGQYIESCLSHPSAAYTRPPQLLTTYASLAESITSIVGCTVQLVKDSQTGAQQYDKYWNALKRDWEGFIARCREVERSARWPLSIGFDALKGTLLVAERERVGIVTAEDLPLQMFRLLSASQPVQPRYEFLEILWTIRTRIGRRVMLSLESRLIDIVHQEIAFPYADIIQDQAQRAHFVNELDEGLAEWITGRLQNVSDLDDATRMVLDVIGGCDQAVKREEDEAELLLHPPILEWTALLTASYVKNSVSVRYDLCLCLVALLFFLSEDLQQWDPSLLAEIFVVFRGVSMLRHTARQPAGDQKASDIEKEDDVVAKMRNMNVNSGRAAYSPAHSLLHQLLVRAVPGVTVPESAHCYLDVSGLLQSLDPAHATKSEVEYCNVLRSLGYYETARDTLAWLPRTPGVCYVQALLWIDEHRYEDAGPALESLASCFGEGRSALSQEDRDALASVLPGQEFFDSDFSFYLHAASLFRDSNVISCQVAFTQLALSVAPVMNTIPLWSTIIKGFIELCLYDDAYKVLVSLSHEKLKQECVPLLVYRMCEEYAVDRLISFNFVSLVDEVEECLSFKARNADPRVRPLYSMILYTWYISRSDYRNASMTMYQRARKLSGVSSDPAEYLLLADLQLEAYALSINALSLLDQRSAWFVVPTLEGERKYERRKRQKLSRFIPEGKFSDANREVEIVEMSDIKYEYALLAAQVELVKLQPQFVFVNEILSHPMSMILKLAQLNLFDTALSTGQALSVDMTDVFAQLTNQCLRYAHNSGSVSAETVSDWLLTDKVTSWTGTTADRAWRYLRRSLELYDGPQSDYAYSKIVFETIIAFERTSPPPWLVQILVDNHPEHLIRLCLRYDVLDYALEYVLHLISKNNVNATPHTVVTSTTWLPYTLIDQVMAAAESQSDLSPRRQTLNRQLRVELSNHLKRMQRLSVSESS